MSSPAVLDLRLLQLLLHLHLVLHLRLAAVHLRLVAVVVPHLLQPFLLYWQSVTLDERGVVRYELEVSLASLKTDGRDSLILRGLTVLCSFPEEVGLVYPPFCYSGLTN